MIRRVACTLVSHIPLLQPATKPTEWRPDTLLALSANWRMRIQRLLITLVALAALTGGPARSQSLSLFSDLVPATPVNKSTSPTTLGVKFWSSTPGTVAGILFYRAVTSPNGYVATLYTGDGSTVLGSVTMATESGPVPGWQQAVFAAPISIKANAT